MEGPLQRLIISSRYVSKHGCLDASYQVSVYLVEGFQRERLKCEKLMDDRRRTPSESKSSHCLLICRFKKNPLLETAWPNEPTLDRKYLW
jgi:hypothetical protein